MTGMDPRQHAPAAERNRDALLVALKTALPGVGTVLEVASGTGQHIVHFARNVPHLSWQPSDVSPDGLASIAAYAAGERLPNLLPPLRLDATEEAWPPLHVNAIVCVNMIHIAPFAACEGLIRHAAALLGAGQSLNLYGPFMQTGVETAPSNRAFDESLRRRDPRWGVRQLDDVVRLAVEAGFRLGAVTPMPANNLTVTFFRG